MQDFEKIGKIPPVSKSELSSLEDIRTRLKPLIGSYFEFTGKPRTDGSNFRKLVTNTLLSSYNPPGSNSNDYSILPPKAKGVPKFLREYIDTYLVTSGSSYNLQVWNRNPSSASIQIHYSNGDKLLANEVRFVIGKINMDTSIIESICILTPDYIVDKFGEFGKPTIKQQLLISNNIRSSIINTVSKVLFEPDSSSIHHLISNKSTDVSNCSIKDNPTKILPLNYIKDVLSKNIIGKYLDPSLSTKQRGQELERLVALSLGYTLSDDSLIGGYPDIRNQMLEIKLQDSQTIDLGRYSPQFLENIYNDFNTQNMRYLIAFTNPLTNLIDGFVLCPGESLGKYFTYVSDKSFKCQRSIPMSFFDDFNSKVVVNPNY